MELVVQLVLHLPSFTDGGLSTRSGIPRNEVANLFRLLRHDAAVRRKNSDQSARISAAF